jgi:hypothetical protein
MAKRLSLLVAMLSIYFAQVWAQVTTNAQSVTVQVSAVQPWTDSGLDLEAGDVVQISTTAPLSQGGSGMPACNAKGVAAASDQNAALPLPSAPAGALLVRLHASGTTPVLVGESNELHITDKSHLTFGMNMTGNPVCQGAFAVTLHVVSAGSAANSAADTKDKTRGEQLKSQLTNAAQVFMSGQFGMGKSETGASNATSLGTNSGGDATSAIAALKVSGAQLDAQLRKSLDSLPRRVNDQFKNLGDMVNFVIVGPQKDVQAALELATWHVADTGNQNAVLNALMQTYEKKDYLAMPMSTLFLFGRKQDFGYEMAEPIAMVASRHHFRIWKAPFNWNGQEVWVGAGTHDIGFAKDQRNNSVTHKIDPAVDGERDNIGSSLQKANKAKTLAYYLPPNPVQDAKNATGDGYHSDGKLLVIFLQ